METGLAGQTAIVTGAAGGIGLSSAKALAGEGASVTLADLDGRIVEAYARELGPEHLGLEVDVTDEASVASLVETVVDHRGSLDVLVTCAGIFQATPFDQITAPEWDRVQAVNLRGTFLTCQAALRVMVPRRRGRIVTIASLGGQTGGLAAGASYAASKAGVVALTKSIARYAGAYGIVVNTVNPGVIETSMTDAWPSQTRDRIIAQTPLGRIGSAEEVAAIVCVLASDAASFVHGAHVDVNGGLLMD